MNEFEKRINALRIQFRNERVQIAKDCDLTIGHLNNAIGMVDTAEARDALRAAKQRAYEAQRQSMKYNRICYMQQLEAIEDEARLHREKNPSRRQLRRMMASLRKSAEAKGETAVTLSLGENQTCTISFS